LQNENAVSAIKRVEHKLNGTDFDPSFVLDVPEQ
jgi:hypothetical protein